MSARTIIIGFLMLVFHTSQAQSDSLARVVQGAREDTTLVLNYRHLYRAYYAEDNVPAMLETAEKGLELSRRLNYIRGIDYFIYYKATALDILGRGTEAIPLYEEGIQVAYLRKDTMVAADYLINTGTAWQGLGELEKSLQYYLRAYDIYQRLQAREKLAKLLNNIAIIYRTQGKYERAEAIYKQSLSLKQELRDTIGIATAYQNLAALYGTTNRYEDAVAFQRKALEIYEQTGRLEDVSGCYSLLGQIYFNAGRLPEAKIELQKALTSYTVSPSVEYAPSTYQLLGMIALAEKSPLQAEQFLHKGLQVARQAGRREMMITLLTELSKAQNQLGKNGMAYLSLQEAFAIRDSVTEEKRLTLLEEMQARFDVAQKDNELKINQLSLDQRTRQRNGFLIAALLLTALVFAVFFILRSRIRINKKIASQESAIQQQTIRQLEQENKLTALQSMIEGQEKERSRIAFDLHDSLGGLLTAVKSHFSALRGPAAGASLYDKTDTLIDEACVEVRRISHNLMPRALALSGLKGALEDLSHDLEKQGLHCDLETQGLETPLPDAQAVTIYRIVQELCNNVVKHADARHLLLQLIRRDDMLLIVAEDDGKGFDPEQAMQKKSLGLSSITSRVQFLQGTIDWDSVAGEGTTVGISIPLTKA